MDGLGLNLATARMAARGMAPPDGHPGRALTPADVAAAAATALGVGVERLRGRGRERSLRVARQLAAALARRLTGASLAEIGQCLGGRRHTTVHSAVRGAAAVWRRDPLFRGAAQRALDLLGCPPIIGNLFPEPGGLFAHETPGE